MISNPEPCSQEYGYANRSPANDALFELQEQKRRHAG
jgi:hypothetical protein